MSPTGNVCLTLVHWKKWGAWKKIVTSVFIESAPFATKIKGEKLVHQRSAYKKVITLLLRPKSSSGEVSQKIHDNDKCCCDIFFYFESGNWNENWFSKMKRALPSGEVALASKIFEQFFAAEGFDDVMACHQNLCSVLQITPGHISKFYPVIKVSGFVKYNVLLDGST